MRSRERQIEEGKQSDIQVVRAVQGKQTKEKSEEGKQSRANREDQGSRVHVG
jgi:hypothetical protein